MSDVNNCRELKSGTVIAQFVVDAQKRNEGIYVYGCDENESARIYMSAESARRLAKDLEYYADLEEVRMSKIREERF